jgi:hypothetical protein
MERVRERVIVGPWFIGVILNWFLFGALIIQLYDYFINFHSTDRKLVKAVAYLVFVVELAQSAIVTDAAWQFIVEGWGDPNPFQRVPVSAACIPTITAVVSCATQLFFAWRIYILTKTYFWRSVGSAIASVSLIQFAAGLAVTGKYFEVGRVPSQWFQMHIVVAIWLGGTVACDVAIAISMCRMLSKARQEPGFQISDCWINQIITNVVETGTITAIIAIIALIFWFAFQNNFLHIVPLVVLGKFYSNVVVCSLNGRKRTNQLTNRKPNQKPTCFTPQSSSGRQIVPGAIHHGLTNISDIKTKPSIEKSDGSHSQHVLLDHKATRHGRHENRP